MNARHMFATLAAIALANAAAAGRFQHRAHDPRADAAGEPFARTLRHLAAVADTAARDSAAREAAGRVRKGGRPVVDDSSVVFLYYGDARRVGVPSDLNGWNAAADTMTRVPGTRLFHLRKRVEREARFEYKLAADSVWMLDPCNARTVMGGYGPNSEIWMPGYAPPREILRDPAVPHGRVDTIRFASALLGRTHPVFVYRPPGYARTRTYPVVYVTDGGEYITLALMLNVLDNLIAAGRLRPMMAVFVDPRTDPADAATSKRMLDYTMSDSFVRFLADELRPRILRSYRSTHDPAQTGIMGASLGGLIATYAAYRRPDAFGIAAAQSPSFWWNEGRMIGLVRDSLAVPVRFWIDTGTIRDAQEGSRQMRDVMRRRGYDVAYREQPEAHNWANWRARLDDILCHFWGTGR